VGDNLRIGGASLRIVGLIAEEPDRVGQGFTLGSTALVDRAGLTATGLVQPGSLYTSAYRLRLPAGGDVAATAKQLSSRFKDGGYQVQDRSNGAPGTRRFIERLGQFLTLVGLTSLIVAGIGVGNGVTSYLESKRGTIATLKLLGATSATIFQSYLLQIGLVALGAIVAGLAIGALVPWIVTLVAGSALPVPPSLALYPVPAAGQRHLRTVDRLSVCDPAAGPRPHRSRRILFRGSLESSPRPGWLLLLAVVAAGGLIAALAIATAREPIFAAGFVGAALALAADAHLAGLADPADRVQASAAEEPAFPPCARQPAPAGGADRPTGGRARAWPDPVHHAGGDRDQPVGTDPDNHPRQGTELLPARYPGGGDRSLPAACRARGAAGGAQHRAVAARLGGGSQRPARVGDGQHPRRRLVPARRPRPDLFRNAAGRQSPRRRPLVAGRL
jgi:hypothetical protein